MQHFKAIPLNISLGNSISYLTLMTYKELGCYFCSGLVMMGKGTLILIRRVNYVDHKMEGRGGWREIHCIILYLS